VSIKIFSHQPNGLLVAAPASPLTQLTSPARLPGAKSRRPASAPEGVDREQDRYRLRVVATNIADVVTSIGGLIFDRAMAGWDVTVEVERNRAGQDDRAIRILGARLAVAGSRGAPRSHVLAVSADVFATNEPVRRQALAARNGHGTDVLLWGRRRPPQANVSFVPVRHQPSAAAQVFKSHALAARGAFAAEPTDEGFYSMA
jgi:hypothetical protein